MEFTVKTPYGYYSNCHLSVGEYANNGHISISIWSSEEGPIADITVNVFGIDVTPQNFSCVDTNNCPWATKLIEELNIGIPVGAGLGSGFCVYPVYKFDRKAIEKYMGG